MLTQAHADAVANAVNRKIVNLVKAEESTTFNRLIPKTPTKSDFVKNKQRKRDTKFEKLMKQSIMVVETLQDEGRYQRDCT